MDHGCGAHSETDVEAPEPAPLPSPENHAVDRHAVWQAVSALPPRQRAVVTLRDVEGHTAEEVSELLEITSGNQRVLLHRGRSVVRAHLERYFATAPVGRA